MSRQKKNKLIIGKGQDLRLAQPGKIITIAVIGVNRIKLLIHNACSANIDELISHAIFELKDDV